MDIDPVRARILGDLSDLLDKLRQGKDAFGQMADGAISSVKNISGQLENFGKDLEGGVGHVENLHVALENGLGGVLEHLTGQLGDFAGGLGAVAVPAAALGGIAIKMADDFGAAFNNL